MLQVATSTFRRVICAPTVYGEKRPQRYLVVFLFNFFTAEGDVFSCERQE